MPYSIDEVQHVTSECTTCAKIKPWFFNSPNNILICSTALFQHLSVDYKGLILISLHANCRRGIQLISFAFPCRDCSSQTAIQCLMTIFSTFRLPSFIHSNQGTSFMSGEFKEFPLRLGIGSSNTTAKEGTANVSTIIALYGTPF